MLNNCVIAGRLAKDIELKSTPNGTSVCTFTIACERDFKNQSGEKETDWVDVVAWRATAQFLSQYATKGRLLIIVGRLQNRTYTDKNGNNKKTTEIIAENVYFGDKKEQKFEETNDDDLPF